MHFSNSHRAAGTFGTVPHTMVPAWHGRKKTLVGGSKMATARGRQRGGDCEIGGVMGKVVQILVGNRTGTEQLFPKSLMVRSR